MKASQLEIPFIRKQNIGPFTAFYFTKPEGFDFLAGQYLQLSIPHLADEKGSSRYFTIASAPDEDELMVVTRMSESSFKKRLFALHEGMTVSCFGPIGLFVIT